MSLQVSAKVEAPALWDHKSRSKAESVNWDISLRVMCWFVKLHRSRLSARCITQLSAVILGPPAIASCKV
jgi:hypothetical protein